jgi:AcrR family transcriptional regulator
METGYREAQRAGQEALRAAILDSAIAVLHTEGITALTMRRIAAEVGASSKVLYTMFGDKRALLDALYREGYVRLRRAQEQVAADPDPLAYAQALSHAYREWALANPAYYRVVFEQAIPGYQPGPREMQAADSSFDISVRAVQACIDAGVFAPGDAYEISKIFWAAIHGVVSLEIAGHFPPDKAAQRYERLMHAVANDLRRKDVAP